MSHREWLGLRLRLGYGFSLVWLGLGSDLGSRFSSGLDSALGQFRSVQLHDPPAQAQTWTQSQTVAQTWTQTQTQAWAQI